jgi:pilus assembly protein Flp/PilA
MLLCATAAQSLRPRQDRRASPISRDPLRNCTSAHGVTAGVRADLHAISSRAFAGQSLRGERLARTARARQLGRGIRVAMGSVACRGKVPRFHQPSAAPPHVAPHDAVQCLGGGFQMSMLTNYVKSFARNEEGQDLLEYALLVALIALVAIVAVTQAGTVVSDIFTDIATRLGGAA